VPPKCGPQWQKAAVAQEYYRAAVEKGLGGHHFPAIIQLIEGGDELALLWAGIVTAIVGQFPTTQWPLKREVRDQPGACRVRLKPA
jgi:hypothetical protein